MTERRSSRLSSEVRPKADAKNGEATTAPRKKAEAEKARPAENEKKNGKTS